MNEFALSPDAGRLVVSAADGCVDSRSRPDGAEHHAPLRDFGQSILEVAACPHALRCDLAMPMDHSLPLEAPVMPIRYLLDQSRGLLRTHADGIVTFHDINAHLDVEQRDHNLGRPELIDARDAKIDVTPDQVRRLVSRAVEMLRVVELGPTAIVTNDDVAFGMARTYALLAEHEGIAAEAFRDVESANRWLDSLSGERTGGSR